VRELEMVSVRETVRETAMATVREMATVLGIVEA
jgi:hypothetical protein